MSKPNIEYIYPLSPGQQGMLTVILLAGNGSDLYFDQSTLTLGGELDVAAWRLAWQRVLDRHPALRTLFVWERQGEPLQVVRRQVELPWQELDWRNLPAAERETRLEELLREDRARGFHLGTPPLMRHTLIRWDDETWKMVWSFHHLIIDGWSLSRVFAEAVTLYAAGREGREPELEAPRSYGDYVAWLKRQDRARAEEFWRGALAGFDEPTPLPYDGTGAGGEIRTASREASWIPPAEAAALSALARRHQLTLNTLFQGAWGALLARATDRDDVIFGSVVSGRPGEVEGIESVVGFFINVLPVRMRVGPLSHETVGTALADLQRRQVEQRDFEHCPLESIQEWSGLPRGSRQIETLLVFQNYPQDPMEATTSLPGFRIREIRSKGASHYPVALYVSPLAGGLDLSLSFHESRLDAVSARRLLDHLRTLLAAFVARPEAMLAALPLLTAEERGELLAGAAGPPAAPTGRCIHTLFEEQAARTPEAPAVEAGVMALTYRELNERAGSLARRLRRLGVGPESIVGLCVQRSPEMVVGMLGVLKTGGAYLPLDPAYPRERLAFMVEDSGARVLLTQEGLAGSLPAGGREVVLLDVQDHADDGELTGAQPLPGNGAYVIYTSGSTGKPKGVLVPHASLVSYVESAGEDSGLGAGDRVLQFASMSFDTSAEEIYPCLTRGATLVLRDDALAGAAESFLREVERLGLTVLDLPTAYWHELVDGLAQGPAQDMDWPACARLVILGGEQARADRLDAWRERVGERCRLLNTYGPTEATIVTTRRDLNGPRDFPAAVPIGRPVPGARVHVVSRGLELLPAGLDGELVIGGAGLARGYLGRPDLTAERFVPDPFADTPGERLYRTGDLARWLPAGELEFRGRVDHQVKVRGFRVELGEIETALRRLAGVREAAVVVREERIVAYVVPAGEPALSSPELRAGLKELLPDYMLPAAFVTLEALPLTPSGKIDRRALPAPAAVRADLDAGSAVPRSPMEELLAGIWSDLLGASGVAPHDSFFDLGGHSLLATRMISRVRAVLGVELPMRAIFEQPTLSGFAVLTERARQGGAGPELPPIVRVPRGGPLPTSFSQQRLWFISRLEPASFAYNLSWALHLAGSLDVASLAAALTGIVCRHESLRTTFGEEDGQPLQVIAEPVAFPLPVVDLAGLPAVEREEEASRIATAEARRPYDLALGPLVRSVLLRLDGGEHALLLGMHHVVSDGWSMGIFVRELGAFYRAFAAGEPAALPELAIQYADFAVWQRQWLSGEVLADQLAWWTEQLGGAPQVLELPLDRPRPAVQTYRGRRADLTIGADLKQRLETMARRLGATPFMILLAGFTALLARYGDQNDVVVGTPIANRGRAELEDLIGFFANTLALRVDLSGDPGFDDLVRRVREMSLGAYAHQDVPFERLVDELRPERSLSHSPVFQVTLVLLNLPASRLDLPGLTLAPLEADTGRAQFDLTLFFYPLLEGGLLARLEYASDLFDAATIERLLGYFHRLLAGVVAEGAEESYRARLSELPLMGEEEREQILHQWNATATAYPREATIPGLFEEQVRRSPEALAVVGGGVELTYAELDRQAEHLAAALLAAGARPDEAVGVCAERSADLIAALLGILKAGGAYVPLDPTYPRERLAGMLADAGARIVVVQEGLEDLLPASDAVRLPLRGTLDTEGGITARPAVHPEQLAYVLFTSGSTGRPKGVAVTHRNVVRLVRETNYLRFGPDEVFLQLATVSFDASTLEIWGPLLNGGRLALYSPGPLDLSELGDALGKHGVSTLWLTAGLFHQMVESHLEGLRPVRQLAAGGDVLSPDLVRRALAGLPGATLLNGYGPTEGTTFTCCHVMRSAADVGAGSVPIGRPIANTRVYLLDATFRPVPLGAVGQLYAAGDGLARGYAGRPELTAERFVPDPVSGEPGARLYATGDLARWRPSGDVEFLGRADTQVKIRGFRIELGEIEAVLTAYPEAETALVIAREDVPGDRHLVAYVVAAPGCSPEPVELRRWLEERLPSYMVPAAFVLLSELPLGPTGKVDRRALPAPDGSQGTGVEHVAPRNAMEEALVAVWAQVLRREKVGIHDNFFELGGDSIRTIQVVARSRERGVRISPRQLFQHQTIAGLAAVAEADSPVAARVGDDLPRLDPTELDGILAELGQRSSVTGLDVEDVYPLSPGQQGMLMVVLLSGETEAYFDRSVVTLAGDLDTALWRRAWQRIVDRHPSLRTLFVWEGREQPLQVVSRRVELPWEELDWRDLPAAEREARLEGFLRRDSDRSFDLRNPPLMRFSLIRWDQETWKVVWSFHHLIVDGWSLSRIFGEAVTSYAAFRDGREPALAPPSRYRDYIAWLQRQDLGRAEAFWRDALAGFDEPTPLPYDGTGLSGEGWSYGRELSWIPPAEAEALSALARRHQLTLNTLFQGAWGALLARATGRDDVVFGSVVSGRPGEVEGIESVVGFFINVLPVRVTLGPLGNEAVGAALTELQSRQVEQRDFEYCPLESIQAWSGFPRGSRLMESLLVFQNIPLNPLEMTSLPGFRIVDSQVSGATHYPITVYVAPRAGGLDLRLDYHPSRLDAVSARQLLAHLRTILEVFTTRPDAGMAELPLMTAEERRELLAAASGPVAPPAGLCIHTLVEEQAARTPDATAVEAGALTLTYRELNARAESLARRLRRLGVGPESIVGLCVERSPEMVAGMLGVLKAGGAYLPLDPAYPQERLAFLLEDSGARVLLTREDLARSLPTAAREMVLLDAQDTVGDDELTGTQPLPGNGAYVIYTSGSTGKPKGVLVPHASLVSYVQSAGEDAGIGAGDRVLQFASMSFDTSAEEIYPCLTRGATLVLRDEAMAGAAESFLREVERLGITVLDLPTAYWHELVAGLAQGPAQELEWPACARLVILGGEQARADRLDAWRERVGERCRLLNTYGPTEATIVTTRRELNGPRDFPSAVPIGRPVPGARVHVVSRSLELLPAGLEGELVIGGAGLARGYLGRPDLTAERFVPDPFASSPGERLYRTGDLARRLPAGELEFRGRTDHQVKVRGFRIELGEIEAALRRLAGVRDAAVVVREERIVAYVVPSGEPVPSIAPPIAPPIIELRAGLKELLPDYMLPAAFVILEALPLTPSGKIDRRSLPAPSVARPDLDPGSARPHHPIEELLAGIWSDLLGAIDVAPHDSFFDLGGHSLLATRMISRLRAVLGVDLPMRAIFEEPTLAGFAVLAERARQGEAGAALPPLVRVQRDGPLPVSFSQQRLWFLDQLEPGSFAYNLAGAVRLAGTLDVASMAGALDEVVRRHESLRTTFVEEDGEPWQVIAEPVANPLSLIDLCGLPPAERQQEARRIATAEARRPYELARGPLVRFALLRLDEREHALLIGMHHVISDGWSMGIFVRELGAFYRALAAGEPAALPELAIQYADFAVWQRQWLSGEVLAERLAWWTGQLGGAPQVVELPLDRPRPAVQGYRGRHADLMIGGGPQQPLEMMARRLGVTPFMILLAGFATLLSRYGGQDDVVVGTPIANRSRAELEDLIGFFANTLALRVDLAGDPGFDALARRVREMALGAYAHQDIPFERLVDELRPERSLSYAPVFQVMLVLQNLPASRLDLAGLTLSTLEFDAGRVQYDLTLFLFPSSDGGLLARLEYAADLFDAGTAERLLGHLQTLLEAAVSNPESPLSRLPLLSAAERAQLAAWDQAEHRDHPEGLLHGLFEAQARRTPEALALVAGRTVLTYAELEERSARLAARLHAVGAGPEVGVAVCLERTADLIVTLLAVLRAGAFYVPLDPRYPEERLRFLLEDSGARVLVTRSGLAAELPAPGTPCLRLDLDTTAAIGPAVSGAGVSDAVTARNLAYLIYTSGSTGRPKAVAIEHRSAVAFAWWARESFPAAELRGVLASTAVTFDLSVFEIFVPLAWGGTVVLAENALELPAVAAALPAGVEITLVNTVPSAMAELLRSGGVPASVRTLNLAGEALPRWLADQAHARPGTERLCNLYGPSEDTTYSTWTVVERSAERSPSIGQPVHDTRAYILDAALERLPVGVPGELYLAGAGLARGYLGRPELTAERFLPDLFAGSGARMYRTGDRVRLRPDGELEYLGRLDHQVKVRGYRIELGEVEAALASQPGVESAVVLVREDAPGDRRLVAYVVPSAGDVAMRVPATELRQALQQILPEPMVPSAFVFLDAFPLTSHGKVDRRALPAPDEERHDVERSQERRSPVEELLAGIWSALLRIPAVGAIGPRDHFFDLGGHSLLGTRVVSRVREVFGVELPLRALFETPTLAGLAARIQEVQRGGLGLQAPPIRPIPPALRDGELQASFAQERLWFLDRFGADRAAYNVPIAIRLRGRLDVPALTACLTEIVRRHESLRTTFTVTGGLEPRVLQAIAPPGAPPLPVADLAGLPEPEREAEAVRLAREEARRLFDLERGPLVRATLARLGEREHNLLLSLHHIVADGWSLGVLVRELSELYSASVQGRPSPLPELPVQYADFAAWQRGWLQGEALEAQLGWWRERLAGAPAVIELPADRPRPPVQSARGGGLFYALPAALSQGLQALVRAEGATLFMALLAGFQALLARTTGGVDLPVGTPIANRNRVEIEDLIGFFVNTLVLRGDLAGDPSFRDLLRRAREAAFGAYAHQDVPFEKLVEELRPERDLSHAPLFQVMVLLQNAPLEALELPDLTVEPVGAVGGGTTKFDLRLALQETSGGLIGSLVYNRDLFDGATVARLGGYLETLLAAAVAHPELPLSALPLLGEAERRQLLAWGDERPVAEGRACLHRLFAAQAARAPERPAVTCGGERLSYRELDERSNRLARTLIAAGVRPGDLVGLCLERSLGMVVAILGVLKAGGAYLPLDPTYPKERLAFAIEDSRIAVVVTEESVAADLPAHGAREVRLDDRAEIDRQSPESPAVEVTPDFPAYVIYTSGSTGRPKGVVVTHANASRLFTATDDWFGFGPEDVWTLFHSYAFDFSVWELWGALLYGGRLVVVPYWVSRSPQAFYELLRDEGVTVLNQTPSAFRQLLWAEESALTSLRYVVFGGEALELASLAPWYERHRDDRPRLVNMYGITETTVHVTYRPLSRSDVEEARGSVLGVPIPDLSLRVLDRHLSPQPAGVPGEIHVGGAGLALGYLGRPELTAERFVPDPFGPPGARLYRSGDLARYLADGDLEYLGRIDHQVKIRGFRIELGEIETALTSQAEVREAVVLAREDTPGEKRLVAYLVAEGDLPAGELHDRLKARLPEYMVPAVFVTLPALPLTANGKVDRKALPAPEAATAAQPRERVASRTELERFLAGLWGAVPGAPNVGDIGIEDDFFALGGNSITGALLINRLQAALGEIVHVVVIFDAPTIARMAAYLIENHPEAVARVWGEGDSAAAGAGTAERVDDARVAQMRGLIRPLPPLARSGAKNPPAVFVLAPPRSGTTLMRVMLGGHPRLFAPPELELLSYNTLAERRASYTGRDAFWLEGLVRAVMEIRGCSAEEATEITGRWADEEWTARQAYGQLQEWLEGRILVDKTPSYALDRAILERAEEDFAEPLYVHLVRHPYGMVRSFEEAKLDQIFFRQEHPFGRRELAELIWLISQENILGFLAGVPARRWHRVHFEELLREPERELRRLCDFLGLDFDPAMVRPYEGKARRMTDGIHAESRMLGDVKFHTYSGIEASTAERWREAYQEGFLGVPTAAMANALGYDLQELAGGRSAAAIPRRAWKAGEPRPVSFAQQRLWFLDRLEPGSVAYNLAGGLRLAGALDVAALAGALGAIVRRHESLRTTFVEEEDGGPRQVIAEPAPHPLPIFDLSALPAAAREEEARRIVNAEAQRGYDLARGPLVRSALLRLGEREHTLLIGMHHIVSDGWSLGIFVREMGELYRALVAGEPPALPELPIQYSDFAAWQRQWLSGAVLEEQIGWWTRRLAGAPQVVELPLDHPRPAVQSHRGATVAAAFRQGLEVSLEALSRRLGVTPYMALLAGFATLLSRYGGQTDVVVGSPVANRGHAEVEDLIGFFANTLALRVDLAGDPRFGELAGRVREMALGAFAHQDVPFERLVHDLRPDRSLSHTPVFQVLLALQNIPQSSLEMAGLTLSRQEADAVQAQFDLSVFLTPQLEGGLRAWVSYVADLFDAATIERLLGHFHQLLEGVIAEGGERARISELPLLTGAERAQLAAWDQAEHRGHPEGLLHGLFEAQAQRTPEALALVAGSAVLSYAELEERSAGLAARLRALGAGPETAVAVCLERTADLVVTLLAVLRAGAFYVPLDPRYPVERLRFLLEDSGAGILVTRSGLAAELPAPETRCLRLDLDGAGAIGAAVPGAEVSDAEVSDVVTARNLAYLIYTSGSTGRPKAVAIEHRSAVAFAWWARESFSAAELRGVLASTAVTFDLSVFEIFVTLAWGGTVVLAENALALPEVAAGLPPGVEITLINTVPSALAELLREDGLAKSVRTINLAGEALPRWLADRAWARLETERLCNLYGPSEDTTYSTWTVVERATERAPAIGRPVHDTRAYVLDPRLERLPVGIPGELCLAGAGLARGYLGRPELTAERFLPDPFGDQFAEPGARMYRTGDLVRLRPDGELDYLGRLDHQVKVRGFRIELGEVEAALAGQPGVESAVVLAREDAPGERRLVAYVVASGAEPAVAELRRGLQQTLPEAFIPSAFVFLESFPLTPHGKVDRRALPAPDGSRQKTATEFVAPRNAVEEALAAVWAEVLRRDGIGVHDNFFELGGDSIRTIQVVSRSRRRGIRIAPRHLFEHQTLAELAAVAEIDRHLFDPAAEVPLPLTPAQRHRASLPGTGREVVRIALPAGIAAEAVERALRELPARHDALRLRLVHGPGGWSQRLAAAEAGVVLERAGSEAEALQLLEGGSEALRAALPPDGNLLLAAHPLALDGPSWEVLLAELSALWRGDAPPAASPVPFVRWAEALAPWAEAPAATVEGACTGPATVLLNEAETSVLLGEARDAYGNTVEEILLAAVVGARPAAWTLAEVDGLRPEIDGLESGSVVVGCLAAPVRVQIEKRAVLGDALKEVKERLRRTLRLGAPMAEEPGETGQPDVTLRWTPPLGSWQAERVSAPPVAGAGPLHVDCRLEGGRLRADWTSAGIYQKEDLERIADRFREQLSALIQHCQSSGAGGFTPSDFPVSRLDQAELDELLAKLGQSME